MNKNIVQGHIGDYLYWKNFNFSCVNHIHHEGNCPEKHCHKDFLELVFVRSGSAVHELNGSFVRVTPGQFFLLKSGDVHCYSEADNFNIYNILFDEYFLQYLMPDIISTPGYQLLFNASREKGISPTLFVKKELFPNVIRLLDGMINAERKKFAGAQTKIISDFMQLIFILSTNVSVSRNNTNFHLYNISRLIAHLEVSFNNSWNLEKMAHYTRIPISNFRQLFSRITGKPPMRYLLELRLQKSIDLLISNELSIGEVAFLCGFNDLNYFSRQFKCRYGKSPLKFLRDQRHDAQTLISISPSIP